MEIKKAAELWRNRTLSGIHKAKINLVSQDKFLLELSNENGWFAAENSDVYENKNIE